MVNIFAISTGGIESSEILRVLVVTRGFTPLDETGAPAVVVGTYAVPPAVTINGIECTVTAFNVVLTHIRSRQKVPGGNINPIKDMGWDGLTIEIRGDEMTDATRERVIKEFSKDGFNLLIFNTGWMYYIKVEEVTKEEAIGFATSYPWHVKAITEGPYRYATSVSLFTKLLEDNPAVFSQDDDERLIAATESAGAIMDITITASSEKHAFYTSGDRWT